MPRMTPAKPKMSQEELVDAIEGEDPDWTTAYEWLREAVYPRAA